MPSHMNGMPSLCLLHRKEVYVYAVSYMNEIPSLYLLKFRNYSMNGLKAQ